MSLQQKNKCVICDGDLDKYVSSNLYDADGSSAINSEVKICSTCGTGVTLPQPDKDSLNALYAKGVYEKGGGRGNFIVSTILNWLQRQRTREIENHTDKRGNLLDVGCGKGRFVTVSNHAGWDAVGQDFSSSQAGFATRRSGVKIWNGELKEFPNKNSFDVVSAWHVLEHTTSPIEFVETMKSLIKKNGVIVLEVPNFQSWQSRIGMGRWFQLDVPRHLWHFSPEGLEQLLKKNGFSVLSTQIFSLELGFFGMLQTLLNVVGFEPQWLFRYLKRTLQTTNPLKISINVFFAGILFLPAVILELVSVLFRRGGVVRCIARKS